MGNICYKCQLIFKDCSFNMMLCASRLCALPFEKFPLLKRTSLRLNACSLFSEIRVQVNIISHHRSECMSIAVTKYIPSYTKVAVK